MIQLPTLIKDQATLRDLVEFGKDTDAVAIDTEFVWERTYYPKLGLIQIGLSDEECFLIDPLAIEDLSPLGELLSDRSVVKIFHDAPQDLVILGRATNSIPQNIFDTKLAAGFADLPSTLSLSNLVKTLLDIELNKSETRTNWLHRPLTDKQKRYALNDVRYLRAVRVLILSRVIGPKIRSWLQEELNLLNNPANYTPNHSDSAFFKIKGSSSLNPRQLATLQLLANWREGMAKKLDRPRGHILKDTTLLEIARQQPRSQAALHSISSLSDKARSRYGNAVLAICEKVETIPEGKLPSRPHPLRLNSREKKLLERLHKLIELKCTMLGIAPELVANSSECKKLVRALRQKPDTSIHDLRQTDGWRKIFLEDFFSQGDD